MTDSEKAALEIFRSLERAQAISIEQGWKLRMNLNPIASADGDFICEKDEVILRIRQIIDRHLC